MFESLQDLADRATGIERMAKLRCSVHFVVVAAADPFPRSADSGSTKRLPLIVGNHPTLDRDRSPERAEDRGNRRPCKPGFIGLGGSGGKGHADADPKHQDDQWCHETLSSIEAIWWGQ